MNRDKLREKLSALKRERAIAERDYAQDPQSLAWVLKKIQEQMIEMRRLIEGARD